MDLAKSSEALLNEYKGNLFEFLVALELSKHYSLSSAFYESLTKDFSLMLAQQEEFIRNYYPHLLKELPVMAKSLAFEITITLPTSIVRIELVGKSAASLKNIGEADIVCSDNKEDFLISVKLSKDKAYVNTKSAGIKSFISKYFHVFSHANKRQKELSLYFDGRFEAFSRELHATYDVNYDSDFSSWILEALPRLPGALKDDGRELYLNFIYDVNNKIYTIVEEFLNENPRLFKECLLALMGQSNPRIIQAIAFYKTSGGKHNSEHFVFKLVNNDENVKIKNKEKSTSFDIISAFLILQIRLKCMNKFTAKSFKVNCAVKHL